MKKRLFVGFPIALGSSLGAALKRTRINASKKEMDFFWIPEANLHVTLNFLGETPAESLPQIQRVLEEVSARHAPVKTSLRGMGAFPDQRHMRTLWVGVRKSRALAHLQTELRDALAAAGFPQEDREYLPHLTVGKLRKSRSATDLLSPYVRSSFEEIVVNRLVLFESLLAGSHPVYVNLGQHELTGAPSQEETTT